MKKEKLVNLANFITFIRLFVGLFLLHFVTAQRWTVSVVFYLIFVSLDGIDGFIARKFNCETSFGRNFDLITDGAIGFGVAILLAIQGVISLLFILLIIPPCIVLGLTLWMGVKIKKDTFIPSVWRRMNGLVFYAIIFCFLLNTPFTIKLAYFLLIYNYIGRTKHFLEVWKVWKKR